MFASSIHVDDLCSNHNCRPLLQTVALLTFQVTMLQERASLQRQTKESHPGTSVAVGTPHRVRSMAVGTSDYNMAVDSVVPETVVERVYNSSTLVRLRNQNVSPRRSVKQRQTRSDQVQTRSDQVQTRSDQVQTRSDQVQTRSDQVQTRSDQVQTRSDQVQTRSDQVQTRSDQVQTRSDQVQADLVIPSDLIQKRYSDSCSNLSVMVTVTRKRSEQGQGDGPDLDAASDEDAPSSRVTTGRGKVSRKDDEDVGSTETPDVVTDEERREVRGSYPRSTYSEKGVGVIEDARRTRAQAGRGKVSRKERDEDMGWSESPDEECQYEGKEDERDVRGRYPRSMDRDMGVRERYTRHPRSTDRERGVGVDQECQYEGTVNERDGRRSYPRRERSMDRERGVGVDQECQYKGKEDVREVRRRYPRRERSTDRERGVGVDQECQYEGKEDPLMVSFTCQTEEDPGREGIK